MSKEQIAVVILAAGVSSRMGGVKKEYQKLGNTGNTVLETVFSAFAKVPLIDLIVIVIPENDEAAASAALPAALKTPKLLFVNGGKTRRDSVFNGLSVLTPFNPCYVLIHDGARPWVSPALICNIIAAVKKHGAVIPMLPLTETPKEIEQRIEDTFIKTHLKRTNIGIAQTPQAFTFPEILHAHEKAAQVCGEEFTDDAEIWGRFAGQVAVIPGEPENKKITFPEDLT